MPKTTDTETVALYGLHKKFLYEPQQLRILVSHYRTPMSVLQNKDDIKAFAPGSAERILRLLDSIDLDRCEHELEEITRQDFKVVTYGQPEWPLPYQDDQVHLPFMLFVKSVSPVEEVFDPTRRFISIVGTRDPSLYGVDMTRRIARQPCTEKRTVVSGLAMGIDTHAHTSALDAGHATIAVLPCGLDSIYPNCNRGLADRIASSPASALVTQFPLSTAPTPVNFLLRNQIIAYLGKETVLVESKAKGGGLVTARMSAAYFNSVYAVPGRLDSPRSEGCNILIREGTAELFTELPRNLPENK